jgi:hypothetical protein
VEESKQARGEQANMRENRGKRLKLKLRKERYGGGRSGGLTMVAWTTIFNPPRFSGIR